MGSKGTISDSSMTRGGPVLCLFFFSGACGLLYAIAWNSILCHSLGPPLFCILSVLTTFLAGLALGSYISGRYIDIMDSPLKIYGFLEGALCIYSFILPWIIQSIKATYAIIYQGFQSPFYFSIFIRYIVFIPWLLIQTILIGAIWPVAVKLILHKRGDAGRQIGRLAGANAFGGSAGVIAAGLFLIPFFGIRNTIHIGAGVDLLICMCALILYKRGWYAHKDSGADKDRQKTLAEVRDSNEGIKGIILSGYGICALAAMIFYVVLLRGLTIFFDSSFSALILTSFSLLFGICLGNLCLAGFADKREDPLLFLGVTEIITALFFICSIPVFVRFPLFMDLILERFSGSMMLIRSLQFLIPFLVILIPSMLLGFSFPMVCVTLSCKKEKAEKPISTVFSINATGALLGIALGGILLMARFETTGGGIVAAWPLILTGGLFLFLSHSLSRITRITLSVLVIVAFILLSIFIPKPDIPLIYHRPCMNAGPEMDLPYMTKAEGEEANKKVIFNKKGILTRICVTQSRRDMSIQVNGWKAFSTTRDISSGVISGHIPLLLHTDPREILLIGLGAGIVLKSIEKYPVIDGIDCIEISKDVIEASGYLQGFNKNAMEDPRLKVIMEDARHFLMFSDRAYDVIISQPLISQPCSIRGFYTQAFFHLLRQRLKPGGIAATIVPAGCMKTGIFKSILYAWHDTFPFVNLWETDLGSCYLLIGSAEDLRWPYTQIHDRLSKGSVCLDLARADIKEPARDLLSFYVMDKQGIATYCKGNRALKDHFSLAEFPLPIYPSGETSTSLLEGLDNHRGTGIASLIGDLDGIDDPEHLREEIDRAFIAQRGLCKAYNALINGKPRQEVLEALKGVLIQHPDGCKARRLYRDLIVESVKDYNGQNRFDLSLWTLREAIGLMPDDTKLLYWQGETYYNAGFMDQAIGSYEKALKICAEDEGIHCHLGIAYLNRGWIDLAIGQFKQAIYIDEDYPDPHLYLGAAYYKKDLIHLAIEEYEHAVALNPDYADAHYNLGIAFLKQGLIDEAISEWKNVIRIRPQDINSRYNLAMAYFNHGEIEQSIALLEEALQIKPDFQQAGSLLQIIYQSGKE